MGWMNSAWVFGRGTEAYRIREFGSKAELFILHKTGTSQFAPTAGCAGLTITWP